jgi:hypothetical protein
LILQREAGGDQQHKEDKDQQNTSHLRIV